MFWCYILSSGYLLPEMWNSEASNQVSTQFSLPEVKLEDEDTSKHNSDPQTLVVNVNKNDLEKAGYNANKTPWTEEEDALLKKLRDEDNLEWV